MNLFEMRKERQLAINAADAILEHARKANREITKQEAEIIDEHCTTAKQLSEKIRPIEEKNTLLTTLRDNPVALLGGGVRNNNDGHFETWKDSRGRSVPVLKNTESFAFSVQNGTAPNFGFGDFIKGMVSPSGNPEILASLSESGGIATGDVTVPINLMPQLIDLMRAKTVCIQAGALTVPIDTETTNIARVAADPIPSWRLEAGAVAIADPTFEKVTLSPRSLAVLVKVSRELIEDSSNINEALLQCFAGAFAVEVDRVGLFGTGVAPQPHGISGTTNVGSVDMGTNGAALTNYDPFVDAVSALLTANAQMPTAAIVAPRTLTKSAKLKDTTGQPMRKPDLLANLPFLATTSVPINQTHGTSNVASEAVIGDFTQLMFGVRTSLRIQLLQGRFLADNMQYGFLADLRVDVAVRHPQSFCEVVGIL
jgi:HK97 family phage major capsid protein